MDIKSRNNKSAEKYNALNVTLVETTDGLKIKSAFGASSVDCPEQEWRRLDARSVARAFKASRFVTR